MSGKTKGPKPGSNDAASANITRRIEDLGDWRGETLARLRKLIHDVDPDVIEEWKWRGTPVWSHDGGICTGESYKAVVKLTFYRGAALRDPKKLFNSSLEGNVRRAIDMREGEELDEAAFKRLIGDAIAANTAARTKASASKRVIAKRPVSKNGVSKKSAAGNRAAKKVVAKK